MENLLFKKVDSQKSNLSQYAEGININSPGKGYPIVKRSFDIIVSIIGLIICIVPIVILMFVIYIDSPGPVFFSQERLGKNGKPFYIYKFRSMKLDAEKNGPQWAVKEDARCTRVGRVLRRLRLDELPQLWNILKGDMSFVGPRPERAYFYDKFEEYIPGFRDRLVVKPGLTGWAQVNGGYSLPPEEKIVYDMEYIEKRSIKMDIKCIAKTVSFLIPKKSTKWL